MKKFPEKNIYSYGAFRDAGWVSVKRPPGDMITKANMFCEQYESNGMYFYYPGGLVWWFEFAKDATWFKLKVN